MSLKDINRATNLDVYPSFGDWIRGRCVVQVTSISRRSPWNKRDFLCRSSIRLQSRPRYQFLTKAPRIRNLALADSRRTRSCVQRTEQRGALRFIRVQSNSNNYQSELVYLLGAKTGSFYSRTGRAASLRPLRRHRRRRRRRKPKLHY